MDGHTDANNEPLKNEPVIAPAAVAAHEDDLDGIVAKGKRRRIELQGDQASESDLTPTTAGSAYVEAISESEDGDEADDDDSASPYSSATSQLPPGASGPPGGSSPASGGGSSDPDPECRIQAIMRLQTIPKVAVMTMYWPSIS